MQIVIITPALQDANNGNWRTAQRWARMLSVVHQVRLARTWEGEPDDLMLALHARRSAASIAAWRAKWGAARPLLLALTGTDLYRDIATDASAQASLQQADRLITLNRLGCQRLPPSVRDRCHVVLQSCAARRRLPAPQRWLRALAIGHLRHEKAPDVLMAAMRYLPPQAAIRVDQVGAVLEPALGMAAQTLMAQEPRYRWLGSEAHGPVLRRLQRASVLVHPSRMEGGAHAVIEAIRSGVPVLASRVDGNVGLLGEDYPGYFAVEDAEALAACLMRAAHEPAWLAGLADAVNRLSPQFAPATEQHALLSLVNDLATGVPMAR